MGKHKENVSGEWGLGGKKPKGLRASKKPIQKVPRATEKKVAIEKSQNLSLAETTTTDTPLTEEATTPVIDLTPKNTELDHGAPTLPAETDKAPAPENLENVLLSPEAIATTLAETEAQKRYEAGKRELNEQLNSFFESIAEIEGKMLSNKNALGNIACKSLDGLPSTTYTEYDKEAQRIKEDVLDTIDSLNDDTVSDLERIKSDIDTIKDRIETLKIFVDRTIKENEKLTSPAPKDTEPGHDALTTQKTPENPLTESKKIKLNKELNDVLELITVLEEVITSNVAYLLKYVFTDAEFTDAELLQTAYGEYPQEVLSIKEDIKNIAGIINYADDAAFEQIKKDIADLYEKTVKLEDNIIKTTDNNNANRIRPTPENTEPDPSVSTPPVKVTNLTTNPGESTPDTTADKAGNSSTLINQAERDASAKEDVEAEKAELKRLKTELDSLTENLEALQKVWNGLKQVQTVAREDKSNSRAQEFVTELEEIKPTIQNGSPILENVKNAAIYALEKSDLVGLKDRIKELSDGEVAWYNNIERVSATFKDVIDEFEKSANTPAGNTGHGMLTQEELNALLEAVGEENHEDAPAKGEGEKISQDMIDSLIAAAAAAAAEDGSEFLDAEEYDSGIPLETGDKIGYETRAVESQKLPHITTNKSFQHIINEAKLTNSLMEGEGLTFENANAKAEAQLQYLNNENKIEHDLGAEIEYLVIATVSNNETEDKQKMIDSICKATGLDVKDVRNIIDSVSQEIRNMAVAEAHKGKSWKSVATSSAVRILAYGGAGTVSAFAGFGLTGGAAIAGVRVLDRAITDLADKRKINAKEKEVRIALKDDEVGKNNLRESFIAELIKAQNKKLNELTLPRNKQGENIFLTGVLKNALRGENTSEQELDSLCKSLDALEEIHRHNRKMMGGDLIDRTINCVGNSRIGKAIDNTILAGGKSTAEKTVVTTMFSAIGLLGRQAPGVRNALMAIAGWRVGDFASKALVKEKQEQNQHQQELDAINSSEEIFRILQEKRNDSAHPKKKLSVQKKRLAIKMATAGIFFAGSFIIPELLGSLSAHAEGGTGSHIDGSDHVAETNTGEVHADAKTALDGDGKSPSGENTPALQNKTPDAAQQPSGENTEFLAPTPKGTGGEKIELPPELQGKLDNGSAPVEPEGIPPETLAEIKASPAVTGKGQELADAAHPANAKVPGAEHGTPDTGKQGAAETSATPDKNAPSQAVASEAKAPETTPELKHQIELATIKKGDGIERSLIRQLKDPKLAKQLGYDQAKDGTINHWAGVKAHQIAMDKGYVGANGQEVRVGTSGIGKSAYVIETDGKGNVNVREYFDGKPVELHTPKSPFETETEKYEYHYGKAEAGHASEQTPEHSAGSESAHTETAHTTEPTADHANAPAEIADKTAKSLTPQEITNLEKSSGVPLEHYTLTPVKQDSYLEALNQKFGNGFSLFEVDTNGDGKTDHIFTYFEGRMVNRDAVHDLQNIEESLRINEIRLEHQIQNSFTKLFGDSMPDNQVITLIQAGKEAGITGFSPLEGSIPGSSFAEFVSYYKGHGELFTGNDGNISLDQMKIFNNYHGQIIDQMKLDGILSRTHDLPWDLEHKMAIAEAMNNPSNPETVASLLGKDTIPNFPFVSSLKWDNSHTLSFDGLVNGKEKLIIDFDNPQNGITVGGFLHTGLGGKHFALNELDKAVDFLKNRGGIIPDLQ
ncbi:MAG: hypothetical protein WC244_03530 [Patescibacteria group bacterium]|jgi:hypothetical protein